MSLSSSIQLALDQFPLYTIVPDTRSHDFIRVDMKVLHRPLSEYNGPRALRNLNFIEAAAHNFLAIAGNLRKYCIIRDPSSSYQAMVFHNLRNELCKHLKLRVLILRKLLRQLHSFIERCKSTRKQRDRIHANLNKIKRHIHFFGPINLEQQARLANGDPLELLIILTWLSEDNIRTRDTPPLEAFERMLSKMLVEFQGNLQPKCARAGLPRCLAVCISHNRVYFGTTAQSWYLHGGKKEPGFDELLKMFKA